MSDNEKAEIGGSAEEYVKFEDNYDVNKGFGFSTNYDGNVGWWFYIDNEQLFHDVMTTMMYFGHKKGWV